MLTSVGKVLKAKREPRFKTPGALCELLGILGQVVWLGGIYLGKSVGRKSKRMVKRIVRR